MWNKFSWYACHMHIKCYFTSNKNCHFIFQFYLLVWAKTVLKSGFWKDTSIFSSIVESFKIFERCNHSTCPSWKKAWRQYYAYIKLNSIYLITWNLAHTSRITTTDLLVTVMTSYTDVWFLLVIETTVVNYKYKEIKILRPRKTI